MPKYRYVVTLSNGTTENDKGTFNDTSEILDSVLKKYTGKWEYRKDGHEYEYYENNTLPIKITIVDEVKDDMRRAKVTEQGEQWANEKINSNK